MTWHGVACADLAKSVHMCCSSSQGMQLTSSAAPQVLVAGSETTGEHRVQIWTPGYLQNGSPRPSITSAPTTVTYAQNITVKYSGVANIDRVVLSRVTGLFSLLLSMAQAHSPLGFPQSASPSHKQTTQASMFHQDMDPQGVWLSEASVDIITCTEIPL